VIRVLVGAPSSVVRAGLESLVRSIPSLEFAGTVDVSRMTASELSGELSGQLTGDVLLIEAGDSSDPEWAVLADLPIPVVALMDFADSALAGSALRAGIRGAISRDATPEEIEGAVHAVNAGLVVTTPASLKELLPDAQPSAEGPLSEPLSNRELEVLDLLAEGISNKLIAHRLGISEHTVKTHVASIFAKIEGVRRVLPDAVYTPMSRLRTALRSAIANPPADPLKPAQMMERWGSRTTAQKLGIAKNSRVFVIDPPSGYARAVGELPGGASFEEESADGCALALWFVHGIAEFHAALPRMRTLASRSRLWILWRKSRQDGLNGNLIRSGAIDVGLVDYKICSINETWSAMVFAVKKAR
jgi:NarL family two-component system response regulator YdfI